MEYKWVRACAGDYKTSEDLQLLSLDAREFIEIRMKKLFIILPIFILLAVGLFLTKVQSNVTKGVINYLELASNSLLEKGYGELVYGKVATNVFTQTVTVNDLRLNLGEDSNDVSSAYQVTAEKVQFTQKLGALDKDGNLTRFIGKALNLKMQQNTALPHLDNEYFLRRI